MNTSVGIDAYGLACHLKDGPELLRARPCIHLRESTAEFVAFGADHTAHDRDTAVRVDIFGLFEITKQPGRTVFRTLAYDAGVEHDYVSPAGIVTFGQAKLFKPAREPFRISLVHLTTDCPDVISGHKERDVN